MRRVGWMVAVIAAAVLGGCGSDDDGPVKPPPGPTYPERTSPGNVLQAMLTAYQLRDSVETKELYDSTYVGSSTDLNDPAGTQVSTFNFSDEVRHVVAMARTTTITSIIADLGPSSSWTRLPSDDMSHPEWAMVQVPTARVEIYDGQTAYVVQSINPMLYAFKPTVAAPGDTTWKIVRWTEIGQGF